MLYLTNHQLIVLLIAVGLHHIAANVTEADRQALLVGHNTYRKQVYYGEVPGQPAAEVMPMLQWDRALEDRAQQWANRCEWKHDYHGNLPQWPSYRQNMAENPTILQSLRSWFDENKYYNFYSGSCSADCGHYTQMVWAKSTHVGCGIARCNKGGAFQGYLFLVCNYAPAGNIIGQRPYEQGEKKNREPKKTQSTAKPVQTENPVKPEDEGVAKCEAPRYWKKCKRYALLARKYCS